MSGSLSTSTAMIATGTQSGTSPRASDVMRSPRVESTAERYITSASLANSDGCRLSPPVPIQRRPPFTPSPTCGTKTSESPMTAATSKYGAIPRSLR